VTCRLIPIKAIFEFFANNPPSIAIAGGVLMWLIGSLMKASGYGGDELLYWAPIVFFAGVLLQLAWLFLRR